jgi:hypothetical protein
VIGWAWDAAAEGIAGCGLSDDEDRARAAAEAWVRAHPGATAVLDTARLWDGTATWSAYWAKDGRARRSRRLRDGRIVWARVPALRPGARG